MYIHKNYCIQLDIKSDQWVYMSSLNLLRPQSAALHVMLGLALSQISAHQRNGYQQPHH